MNRKELIELIDGPLAAFFGAEVTTGRFFELADIVFPWLDVDRISRYPLMLNLDVKRKEPPEAPPAGLPPCPCWDVWTAGKEWFGANGHRRLPVWPPEPQMERPAHQTITNEDVYQFLDGPMAAYLAGECDYKEFIGLLRGAFPDLRDLTVADFYPRLFNLTAKDANEDLADGEEGFPMWDVWAAGKAYMQRRLNSGQEGENA